MSAGGRIVVVGDAVGAAVDLRPRVLPRFEDGGDRALQLVARVLHGGGVALVVLGIPAGIISIMIGHYSRRDRRMLWLVLLANALVASTLLNYFIGF